MLRLWSSRRAAGVGLVMALALVCACEADDGGPHIVPGGMTLTEYCLAEAYLDSAWCAYLSECCNELDEDSINYLPTFCSWGAPSPESCMTLQGRLDNGSIGWNGNYAMACLEALASYIPAPPDDCNGLDSYVNQEALRDSPLSTQIPACRQTIIGLIEFGEECVGNIDCADGLSCQGAGPYYCALLASVGGPCDWSGDCMTGYSCIQDRCELLRGLSEGCERSSDCQVGLICGSESYCRVPILRGMDCQSAPMDCESSTTCDPTTSTCEYYGGVGTTCDYDFECSGRCDEAAGSCALMCGGTWF